VVPLAIVHRQSLFPICIGRSRWSAEPMLHASKLPEVCGDT